MKLKGKISVSLLLPQSVANTSRRADRQKRNDRAREIHLSVMMAARVLVRVRPLTRIQLASRRLSRRDAPLALPVPVLILSHLIRLSLSLSLSLSLCPSLRSWSGFRLSSRESTEDQDGAAPRRGRNAVHALPIPSLVLSMIYAP